MVQTITEQIFEWGKEELPDDVFVVDVEYKPNSKKLSVFIDADGPLTIEQCRKFNQFLSAKLDEIDFGDGRYTLEVSSPGVDRPLKLSRQYNKHIGRELEIKLLAQTEMLGKLTEVKDQSIVLELKDKKKGYKLKEPVLKEILFEDILSAKVIVTFN
ncbi:MAG: ribosome maturation factor RimP [Bacteroidia bacterium]